MSAFTACFGKVLPNGKAYHLAFLLSVVTVIATTGCRMSNTSSSVVAPQSTVIAQAVATSAASTNWLESVSLSYAKNVPSLPASDIIPVKFSDDSMTGSSMQVLGIRYPHPDGHKDRARVELVIADSSKVAQNKSWYRSLGKTLSDTLPGMAWGDGIRQAKALDLPIQELQQLLVESQAACVPAHALGQQEHPVQLSLKINGQHQIVKSGPIPALDKIVNRVAQEGKLISYSGNANELQQLLNPNPRMALVPLPPVNN